VRKKSDAQKLTQKSL